MSVVIRPALLAVALLFLSSRLPAQHAAAAQANDTPLIPLTTRWPSREGIAAMAPRLVNPMAVEATSDGWVVLTPLATFPDRRDEIPAQRLHASPADVELWTTAARQLLARIADSSQTAQEGQLPSLGRGRVHLTQYYPTGRTRGFPLQIVGCEGVYTTVEMSASELATLTGALERATIAARRHGERPAPPTLERPYYASEVSCGARREGEGPLPSFPSTMPRSSRRYTEVGVRFIVDTAGFVEPRSVALLPGAPPALAGVARTLVTRWRYRPAEWSGLPLRQVVTTALVFDPDEKATRRDSVRIAIAARERSLDPAIRSMSQRPATLVQRDGGWVHVRVGRWRPDGVFDGYQEWFHPDSVDEWISRTRELIAADSASPKHPPPPRDYSAIGVGPAREGNRLIAQYQMGWSSDTERLKLVTLMSGCSPAMIVGTPIDRRLLDRLSAAARGARFHRASLPSGDRTYARGEVSCASFLPPTSPQRGDLPGVWRYPRAPYPDALSKENVRAEVLSSFVVDTTGTPIASTLLVAPGSDPRAVSALRQSIERVRFRPAARAGRRVPTRVVRTWLFEPPSSCADERDGIDCARQYSKER
ncbi:MAG TPA: energy transducer TonB [Gemmatimonadaceae bacterium]